MTDLIEKIAKEMCCPAGCDAELRPNRGSCGANNARAKSVASILLQEMNIDNLPKSITQAGGELALGDGSHAHIAGDIWQSMLEAFAKAHSINLEGE